MGTQTHAVGVADAHAGRHHVVGHARELVDAEHLHATVGGHQAQSRRLEVVDRAGTAIGPDDVGQHAEDAVDVHVVRPDQAVREQVQAQVRVGDVGRRRADVDDRPDDVRAHAAVGVHALEGSQRDGYSVWAGVRRCLAQRRSRVPGVQDDA